MSNYWKPIGYELTDNGKPIFDHKPKAVACLKYEVRNVSTGKKRILRYNPTFSLEDDQIMFNWNSKYVYDKGGYNTGWVYKKVPVADVEIRIEDKNYKRYLKVKENLQVGDFVKCKGTRSGDWNKVESIRNDTLFGPKYTKPEEGNMRYVSSDNHLTKVMKIIRDGVEIL